MEFVGPGIASLRQDTRNAIDAMTTEATCRSSCLLYTSSVTSYFTDALFTEVVRDIMDKEGVDESTAQSLLYTGGYTIEATVNPRCV